MGNCCPGPGLRNPPVAPAAPAPKSTLLRATLEADPMKTASLTPSCATAGLPELNSEFTALACVLVSCTVKPPADVGGVTGPRPDLFTPMLREPLSSRSAYS